MRYNSTSGGIAIILGIVLLLEFSCSTEPISPLSIIEIVERESSYSNHDFLEFVKEQRLDSTLLYNRDSRWVLQVDENRAEQVKMALMDRFPEGDIKIYLTPFYLFSKKEHCSQNEVAPHWDYTIMTANLVDDSVMQKEYMEYHKHQFDEWPEVSEGFCNASFQQVLVYRNGRQLMLVIAIAKGESLDNLNPKTTENNPKVVEWNDIMKPYQERVVGAPEGAVWIDFENVNR